MSDKLTAERVKAVFHDCLFNEGEPHDNFVKAEGVVMTVGFHPGRLAAHDADIEEMLGELPEQFHDTKGGGWSFLNACMTKDGEQWGEHPTMDQLFQLGMAVGRVRCCFPRELWGMLPGGMPYYVVVQKPVCVTS